MCCSKVCAIVALLIFTTVRYDIANRSIWVYSLVMMVVCQSSNSTCMVGSQIRLGQVFLHGWYY